MPLGLEWVPPSGPLCFASGLWVQTKNDEKLATPRKSVSVWCVNFDSWVTNFTTFFYLLQFFHKRDSEEHPKLVNEWFLGWNPSILLLLGLAGWLLWVTISFPLHFQVCRGKKTIYSKSLNNGLGVKWSSRILLTLNILCIFWQLNFVWVTFRLISYVNPQRLVKDGASFGKIEQNMLPLWSRQ